MSPKRISALEELRVVERPVLPSVFGRSGARVEVETTASVVLVADQNGIAERFPNSFGQPFLNFTNAAGTRDYAATATAVILSGGQAPGGHNVVAGLFDGLKSLNPDNQLFGFLGGPDGLVTGKVRDLTGSVIDGYRNTGGFDMIGSGRGKIERAEQFDAVREVCESRNISAVVIIGGDDSNTNAAILAEHFQATGSEIQVIGCPKTIDGDLKNACIEASFGFDTASKVYSYLIGNVARDAASAQKYWHFLKLMGRSASHITLECALQTQPNIALISEEVAARGQTLDEIIDDICDVIVQRAKDRRNYGIALVPEGLIEFIPEMQGLIRELNELLAAHDTREFRNAMSRAASETELTEKGLTAQAAAVYLKLPRNIRAQLVHERDSHGNVPVSSIETEKLLTAMVSARLAKATANGGPKVKFQAQHHFFGYEGRCSSPSNFDTNYAYSLGYTAAALIGCGRTGYLARIARLISPAADWVPGGVPISAMLTMERRQGETKSVIGKALVNLAGRPFAEFAAGRKEWKINDCYVYTGPIQFFGPPALCDATTETLHLEQTAAE